MEQLMDRENVLRPTLGEEEMQELADHLAAIYAASKQELAKRPPSAYNFVKLTELKIPPPKMDCVQDRLSGLHYAAHCIGIALASCGGLDLMHMVDSIVAEKHGIRVSVWLDHRWNGVMTRDGGLWCA